MLNHRQYSSRVWAHRGLNGEDRLVALALAEVVDCRGRIDYQVGVERCCALTRFDYHVVAACVAVLLVGGLLAYDQGVLLLNDLPELCDFEAAI